MAKKVQIKWTDLQREIAGMTALTGKGRTFDELVELGYTKSVVSKVLNALQAGQKPPEEGEPRTENPEPRTENPELKDKKNSKDTPPSRTDVLANATGLRFVNRVYTLTYTPIIRAAQEAAVEFWDWPEDMTLEDFLDTLAHMCFKEHGITLAGATISEEAREVLEAEHKAPETEETRETRETEEVLA